MRGRTDVERLIGSELSVELLSIITIYYDTFHVMEELRSILNVVSGFEIEGF